ncbi:MAG: hypothetical protein JJT95_04890 [Pararhodobacter sp.]|nr:hypothetical protein [Pararhodobacter sp.]
MRISMVASAALLALAACADGVAPQGQGRGVSAGTAIGGGDYQRYLRTREDAARSGVPYSVPPEHTRAQGAGGAPLAAPMAPRPQASSTAASAAASTPATAASGGRDSAIADQQRYDPDSPRPAAATRPAPGQGESGPVPLVRVADASAAEGPNIVAYALRTSHPVGTERYPRRNPLRWQLWERNCLQFTDQNAAQEAFLAAGGPERDRQNLDPVGDGYACWWDPEPIRRAVRAGD